MSAGIPAAFMAESTGVLSVFRNQVTCATEGKPNARSSSGSETGHSSDVTLADPPADTAALPQWQLAAR